MHVCMYLFLPHREAHSISELNFLRYFLISGISLRLSGVVGFTLTEICEPRLTGRGATLGGDRPAPKPNAENDACFLILFAFAGCLTEPTGPFGWLPIAWRYCGAEFNNYDSLVNERSHKLRVKGQSLIRTPWWNYWLLRHHTPCQTRARIERFCIV